MRPVWPVWPVCLCACVSDQKTQPAWGAGEGPEEQKGHGEHRERAPAREGETTLGTRVERGGEATPHAWAIHD